MSTIAFLVRRAARVTFIAMAASSVAILAGCGSEGPAARTARTTSSAMHRQAAFGPVGAIFSSRLTGWMLGITLTGRQHLDLFRTADGGRHWAALPTPPPPWQWQSGTARADSVSGVMFADARDGWLYGPGLWATHDGGRTWRRQVTHGAKVDSVQATGGQVLAVFSWCRDQCRSGRPRFAVYRSPAGRDHWRPVRGASGPGAGQVALVGRTGYVLGIQRIGGRNSLLEGPAFSPGRWRHRPVPCRHGFVPAIVAASAAGLAIGCELPPGGHPVPVHMYRSRNGGLTWHALTALSLQDGIGTLTITPAGTMIAGGMYNGITISRDGGRTWHWVRSVDKTQAVGGGGPIEVTMFGNRVGVVLVQAERGWLTRDGGRAWMPVTIP